MLLKELIRFSTQHRTLYCYMILSIWIFLLIAGMYKYIGHSANSLSSTLSFLNGKLQPHNVVDSTAYGNDAVVAAVNEQEALRRRQFKERCAPQEQLQRHDDGGILEGWKLQGVLLVIRHGDRGPMSHVRGVQSIDCGIANNALVNRYRSFLYNSSASSSGANHMYWNKVGPFHGFPLLPPTEKACLLGQLTYKGISQLLQVGEMLHQIYAHPLGLLLKQTSDRSPLGSDSTPHSLLNSDEVVLFTTRYRRTFQSALALLFTLLPSEKWLSLNARESHSMAFCFTDCACAQAEALKRRMRSIHNAQLALQPTVSGIMQLVGSTLLQHTPNGINDLNEVIDAVNMLLCHEAPLPCRRAASNSTRTPPTTQFNAVDLNDVINIDQDDSAVNVLDINAGPAPADYMQSAAGANMGMAESCIEQTHLTALLTYANAQSQLEAEHVLYKRVGLLRAYGMVRHIVSYMLRMISGDRTKFVLYSGHDWTLQYLTAALGIKTGNTYIPYASRLAFELYKSEAHTDYYFRVVYNGHDVTQQIDFCEGGKSLRVTRDSRGNKADLCPIENIIRFLHEDYFSPLNATNFKDACSVPQAQKVGDF